MKALFHYLDKIPKTYVPIIGVILVVLIGYGDYLTGYEISFLIFYLLPIIFVSWFGKRIHAVLMCILSAVVWLWADISAGAVYSSSLVYVWNVFIRLGFFLITAILVSKLDIEQAFARTDFLTRVSNSRVFYESAKIESDRVARFHRPLTIAYIDVDNFKQVNDLFGHSQGNNLLKSIAKVIKSNARSIDIISRLGGDEFAILFPETNEVNAKAAINKVQEALLDMVKNKNWPITFSIGVVTCYKLCDVDELIKEADTLMYTVKKSGKNGIAYKIHGTPKD